MGNEGRSVGVVKFYNSRRGYGFVSHSEGGDVFFHLSHLRSPFLPMPGHVVRFRLGQNREGAVAEEIEVVDLDQIDRYDARITSVSDECIEAVTDDGYAVTFLRADYVPRHEADALSKGQLVELNLLVDEGSGFRARVVRPPDWTPTAEAEPFERIGDEEDENRRLLGTLYKTESDEEALHATELLVERNLRAALSALVSRVFDLRLTLETRREICDALPRIYFDEEVRDYLESTAAALRSDLEAGPEGPAVSARMLLTNDFPVRWSQYLLPFGLSLLRALAGWPAARPDFESAEGQLATEVWLSRVWRHIVQQRSGFGYICTTALVTLDELTRHGLLLDQVEHSLREAMAKLDGEFLACQIRYLPEELSVEMANRFLPPLLAHPGLSGVLSDPDRAARVTRWVQIMLEGVSEPSPATILALAPLLQAALDPSTRLELRSLILPHLRPEAVVAALATGHLERELRWRAMTYLQEQGALPQIARTADGRRSLLLWAEAASADLANPEAEPRAIAGAAKLVEALDSTAAGDLDAQEIVALIGQAIRRHVELIPDEQLIEVLHAAEADEAGLVLPALVARLGTRPTGDKAMAVIVTWLSGVSPALVDLAQATRRWHDCPANCATINQLAEAIGQASLSGCPRAARYSSDAADVARELLAKAQVLCAEGLVVRVAQDDLGGRQAWLAEPDLPLPERLFVDRADCALHRYVRLVLSRGAVLGVAPARPPAPPDTVGILADALSINERNVLAGELLDTSGQTSYFEHASLAAGQTAWLSGGQPLVYLRVAASSGSEADHVALNARSMLGDHDLPLLLAGLNPQSPQRVAVGVLTAVLSLDSAAAVSGLRSAWLDLPAEVTEGWANELPAATRAKLDDVLSS